MKTLNHKDYYYSEKVREGAISDLMIDAHQAKSFEDFYKNLVNQMKAAKPGWKEYKEYKDWAKEFYDEAITSMKAAYESKKFSFDEFISEAFATQFVQPGICMEIGGKIGVVAEVLQFQNETAYQIAFKANDNKCYRAFFNGHMYIIANEILPTPGV